MNLIKKRKIILLTKNITCIASRRATVKANTRSLYYKDCASRNSRASIRNIDRLESNPFYQKFSLSRKQWCLTAAGCIFIVPIRMVLIAGLYFGLWMPYKLMVLMKHPKSTPTLRERYFLVYFFNVLYRACGVWPKYEGIGKFR